MTDAFRWYVPFGKVEAQPDGSVIVEGPVSSEAIDTENEIVDYNALKAAASDYMEFANVREMHDPHTAAGRMLGLDFDDDARRILGRSQIVDPGAVKKVLTGVYKGYSVGGRKLAWALEKSGKGNVRRLTKLWWGETSLVDRPANPEAIFTLAKRDYTDTEKESGQVGDTAEGTPDQTADETPDAPAPAPEKVKKGAKKIAKRADRVKATFERMAALRKGGNKSVKHVLDAMEEIVCAISTEASEGDTDGVSTLQGVLASLQKFVSAEAAEVGPDEETDDAEPDADDADDAVPFGPESTDDAIEMAAQIGSLRKAEHKRTDRKIARLRKRAKANRAVLRKVAALAESKPVAAESPSSDEALPASDPLAKAASQIDALMEKVGTDRVSTADLATVKAEVLAALDTAKGDLAKAIAAQPVGGGPVIRPDLSRFGGEDKADSALEERVLAKAMQRITDPIAREALGKAVAAGQIGVLQQNS